MDVARAAHAAAELIGECPGTLDIGKRGDLDDQIAASRGFRRRLNLDRHRLGNLRPCRLGRDGFGFHGLRFYRLRLGGGRLSGPCRRPNRRGLLGEHPAQTDEQRLRRVGACWCGAAGGKQRGILWRYGNAADSDWSIGCNPELGGGGRRQCHQSATFPADLHQYGPAGVERSDLGKAAGGEFAAERERSLPLRKRDPADAVEARFAGAELGRPLRRGTGRRCAIVRSGARRLLRRARAGGDEQE